MSEKCNDPRFREMLHNYEMGLLSEEEETEFELHLYSCEYCLNKIKQFEETARHLKFDPTVRAEINKLAAEEIETAKEPSFFKKITISTWLKWSPAMKISLVAVAVFVIVTLNLVRIEFGQQESVQASQNSIIVTEFQNLSGNPEMNQLGIVAMNLLITDLAESPSIQIVAKLYIMEVLLYLGYEPEHKVDKEIALKVASETGSNLIVEGNIIQTQPNLVLTTQIIDVKSGVIVATQKIVGGVEENIFSIIDRLALEIRTELLPSHVVDNEIDCSIADITSHSEEAYYLYLQGVEDDWAFRYNEARRKFRAAIELDSTFAMAYYLMSFFTSGPEQDQMIAKALLYSEKCSCKERFSIRSRQAQILGNMEQAKNELKELLKYYPDEREGLYGLAHLENLEGNYIEAIRLFEKVVSIYPKLKNAYNELAYLYSRSGDFEKAIEALEKYIKLAPEEANPWDSKGEIYARFGYFDEAITAFKQALKVDPDFAYSKQSLMKMYLLKQDYDKVQALIDESMLDEDFIDVSNAYYYLAILKLRQGLFTQAFDILDKGIRLDENSQFRYMAIPKHWQKTMLLHQIGRHEDALIELERCNTLQNIFRPEDKLAYRHYYGQFLAEMGRLGDAERVAENIKSDLADVKEAIYGYWYLKGCIELKSNKPAEAIISFNKAAETTFLYPMNNMLARAYLATGQPEKTIELLTANLSSYNSDRIDWSLVDIKANYYLGQAYEQTGRVSEAAQSYETFLGLWNKTDVKLKELDDARDRLSRLKS